MSLWSEDFYARNYLGNRTELSSMRSVTYGSLALQGSHRITGRKQLAKTRAPCQCQVNGSLCQIWWAEHVALLFLSVFNMFSSLYSSLGSHWQKSEYWFDNAVFCGCCWTVLPCWSFPSGADLPPIDVGRPWQVEIYELKSLTYTHSSVVGKIRTFNVSIL